MGTVLVAVVALVAAVVVSVLGVLLYENAHKLYGWCMWRLGRRVRVTWFANMVVNHLHLNYGPVHVGDMPRAPRLEDFLPEPARPEMPVREDFDDDDVGYAKAVRRYKLALRKYQADKAEYDRTFNDAFARIKPRWDAAWLAYESAVRQKCRSWENGGARTMGGDFQTLTPVKRCFPVRSVAYFRKGDPRIAELERQQGLTTITDLNIS